MPDVVFQPMDDSAIIVSLKSEEIYKLNSTGMIIAELVAKEKSLQEMITILSENYDVQEAELKNEILVLIEELITAGLVEVSTGR